MCINSTNYLRIFLNNGLVYNQHASQANAKSVINKDDPNKTLYSHTKQMFKYQYL